MVCCKSQKKSSDDEYKVPPIQYFDKPCNECSIICPGFALVVLVILVFGFIYKQIDTINYEPFACIITNVTYSTLIINMSNPNDIPVAENFVQCDCGRKCISDYGTCIKLWGRKQHDPSDTIRMINDLTTESIKQCTFQEEDCSDGENIINRINAVDHARDRALSYLNTNQTCYTKDQKNYYLSNDMNMEILITSSIATGLIFICCCGLICHYICFKYKHNYKRKHKSQNKINVVHMDSFRV